MAAGFDVAPGEDGFWKLLLPNVAHVPVANIWGERDPLTIQTLDGKRAGTFAESNRLFAQLTSGMDLPVTNVEVPAGLHNDLSVPRGPVIAILRARREGLPRKLWHVPWRRSSAG